jgi:hypothetical protein
MNSFETVQSQIDGKKTLAFEIFGAWYVLEGSAIFIFIRRKAVHANEN